MKQGKGPWRKTIFRWLSAYALVVISVVILVALISVITLNTVENSARLELKTKMENLRTSMDAMLVDVDRAFTLIGSDERLHVMGASTQPYSPFELYMLYDLNRSFARHIAMQGPWNSIYVYVKKSGFILFNNSKFDLPSAFKLLDYGMPIDTWQEKLDVLQDKVFVSQPAASEPGRTYLEYWFPNGSGPDSNSVLVARFNLLEFESRLNAMRTFHEETLLLLDERGRVLLSSQPLDATLAAINFQIAADPYTFEEKNGLLIGYARSKQSGWTYVSVLPKDFLFSRSVYSGQIALALCIFLLVVGLVLSILAVLQRIRPIKRLYDLAKQTSPGDEPGDAYSFLETSMRHMIQENNEVHQTLHQYHSLVLQDVLLRLLSGDRVDADMIRSAQVQFRWNQFLVVLVSCQNSEDLFFGEYRDNAQTLSYIAMGEVLQKTFGSEFDLYTLEHDELVVGVMSVPEGLKDEQLTGLAQNAQRILKSQMGLSTILVISDLQLGTDHIAVCYEHAKETLECELLVGSDHDGLLRYQSDSGDGSFVLDMEAQLAFSRAIKKRDFAQGKALMNHMIDSYLSSTRPIPDMARALMFILVNTMLDALRTADTPFDEEFIKSLRPAQRMLACASIRELRLEMEKILDETESYTAMLRSDQEKYINGIKAFVQENYIDTNMNVSGIALEMGVSVSMLSKLFKKNTDMGLLNYINHIRIDQACQLLTTSDLTLTEIAQKTGFLDSCTLIRNFKRTMGVTPGKYKLENGRIQNDCR